MNNSLEITEVAGYTWKLYKYLYQSRELKHLTESLEHGHTSLQLQLQLVVYFIVQIHLNNSLNFRNPNELEYRYQHV